MAAAIRKEQPTANVELEGEYTQLGMFRVVMDGEQLWNKHDTGTFPETSFILSKLPQS